MLPNFGDKIRYTREMWTKNGKYAPKGAMNK